eukprot:5314300-Amphidinium_carterae.1
MTRTASHGTLKRMQAWRTASQRLGLMTGVSQLRIHTAGDNGLPNNGLPTRRRRRQLTVIA